MKRFAILSVLVVAVCVASSAAGRPVQKPTRGASAAPAEPARSFSREIREALKKLAARVVSNGDALTPPYPNSSPRP